MLEDVRVKEGEGMGLNSHSNGSNVQIDCWNQITLCRWLTLVEIRPLHVGND